MDSSQSKTTPALSLRYPPDSNSFMFLVPPHFPPLWRGLGQMISFKYKSIFHPKIYWHLKEEEIVIVTIYVKRSYCMIKGSCYGNNVDEKENSHFIMWNVFYFP